ncbi:MAG: RimK family alpha-L-glutamate ligase [Atopobiaceae bacterium]
MKLSGYLIERYTDMGSAYTCRRLVEEAAALGMDLSIKGIADMGCTQDGTVLFRGEPLAPVPFVVNRYKWGHLLKSVNALAGRSYNSYAAFSRYVDKAAQVEDIASGAFRMPRWVLAHAGAGFEMLGSEFGVPFVAKGLASSEGREIWLIESREDLARLQNAVGPDRELLFEQCIEESLGQDIRVFGIRGKAVAAMRRKAEHGFRANYALGALLEKKEIDDGIRQAVHDVWEETGLDFFGLDLLEDHAGYWFCEVNVMAGMQGIESVTDTNVAGLVMRTIRDDLA